MKSTPVIHVYPSELRACWRDEAQSEVWFVNPQFNVWFSYLYITLLTVLLRTKKANQQRKTTSQFVTQLAGQCAVIARGHGFDHSDKPDLFQVFLLSTSVSFHDRENRSRLHDVQHKTFSYATVYLFIIYFFQFLHSFLPVFVYLFVCLFYFCHRSWRLTTHAFMWFPHAMPLLISVPTPL